MVRAVRRILAATVCAVCFATPAAAQSSAPAAIASPVPTASGLPEIGRTRARVLCTALREAVGPAILTTQHADAQFSAQREETASKVIVAVAALCR